MGNHHSAREGKYDFANPTCSLKSPDGFGRSARSGLNHDNNSRLNLLVKPTRSQSLKHGCQPSSPSNSEFSNSKFTAFANGKGRRSSADNFAQLYNQDGKNKNSKAHQHQKNPSSRNCSPPSCLTTASARSLQQTQTSSVTPEAESVLQGLGQAVGSNTSATATNSLAKEKERILASNQLCMMSSSLDKFAKQLVQMSRSVGSSTGHPLEENSISRLVFQKHVVSHSAVGENYLWEFFIDYNEKSNSLKSSAFVQGGEKIYAPITDKEQVNFYVKLFAKGKTTIDRTEFIDLLISAYQLSSVSASRAGRDLNNSKDFDGKEWIESVTKSCFHIKEEMSVFFVSNWILTNIPRLLIPMHKYYLHQLTTGLARVSNLKESTEDSQNAQKATNGDEVEASGNNDVVTGINPILMWLLLCSLPSVYLSVFEKKGDQQKQPKVKLLNRMNSRDLLLKMLHADEVESHQWSLLYDGADQGMSINRFQYHVFSYKGPTLMFIKCENDYTLLVGIDTEWKESCHFWGGEQCFIIQLKPEFHVIEVGGKSLYANFSIRGYPFGIQAGKDPRNVAIEIKPDFEQVYFKKIPCRIISMVVWGCAPPQMKTAQAEHKKWEAKESEKQKKINLNNVDWNDNPDKYLLELAGNYRSYGN